MSRPNNQEIYQSLLDTAERFAVVKDEEPKAGTGGPKVPGVEEVDNLIKGDNLARLQQVMENNPTIKNSGWWENGALVETAIENNRLEILKYLDSEGINLKTDDESDCTWAKTLEIDNVAMFQWLWEKGAIDWDSMLENNQWVLGILPDSPAISAFVVSQLGIDIGFVRAIKNEHGVVAPDNINFWEDEVLTWVKDLLKLSLTKPEQFVTSDVFQQLKASELETIYPKVRNKAIEKLWGELSDKQDIGGLKQCLEQKIFLTSNSLVDLWYNAKAADKETILEWLSSSPTLIDRVKLHWPDGRNTKESLIWIRRLSAKEYSLKNIQMLNNLGFDLTAAGRGTEPWIHRNPLRKDVITWLAKNKPEIFECINLEGETLMETFTSDKKAFAEKALLKGVLVSRQKPLRTKVIKTRI